MKLLRLMTIEAIHTCFREMDIRGLSLVLPIKLGGDATTVTAPASLIRGGPLEESMPGQESPASRGMAADVAVPAGGMTAHARLLIDRL